MGAGLEMLLSGTPLGVLLGLGLIAAIGFLPLSGVVRR